MTRLVKKLACIKKNSTYTTKQPSLALCNDPLNELFGISLVVRYDWSKIDCKLTDVLVTILLLGSIVLTKNYFSRGGVE